MFSLSANQCTLQQLQSYKTEVIFIGDLNIHVNNHNNSDAKRLLALLEIMEMFEFNQHIHYTCIIPHNKNGNTLDLVITKHQSMVNYIVRLMN